MPRFPAGKNPLITLSESGVHSKPSTIPQLPRSFARLLPQNPLSRPHCSISHLRRRRKAIFRYETIIYHTREAGTRRWLQVQGQPSETQRVPGQPGPHIEAGSKTKQKTSITQEKKLHKVSKRNLNLFLKHVRLLFLFFELQQ